MDTMNKDEAKKEPGEAARDAEAKHGYRNEVTWDEGKGRQPYANRGDVEQGAEAMPETEAGNAGDAAGRNLEQAREVKEMPGRPAQQKPRET